MIGYVPKKEEIENPYIKPSLLICHNRPHEAYQDGVAVVYSRIKPLDINSLLEDWLASIHCQISIKPMESCPVPCKKFSDFISEQQEQKPEHNYVHKYKDDATLVFDENCPKCIAGQEK